jgi:hypothetical protein
MGRGRDQGGGATSQARVFTSAGKADFQSSHEAPRCECMHEHFHPITMLNSSF